MMRDAFFPPETPPADDQQTGWSLVEQAAAGDDRAFEALMERYKRPILNFVFRIIGEASEAEDVAQDVFVRVYRAIHQPGLRRTTGEFSTWLFRVARNAALDCLRRRKRHPAESLTALEDHGETLVGAGSTAAEEAAAEETGEQIAAAVDLLPEDQRTALVLAEYEGLPYSQIAGVLKCSRKSVEARLYRARRFLRQRLARLLP